jgi:hypothetical protein
MDWSLGAIRPGNLSEPAEHEGVEMTSDGSKANGTIEKKQTSIGAH